MKHIVRIGDVSKGEIEQLFTSARNMRDLLAKNTLSRRLEGKILTALFYEPSSRTFGSFIAAMQRLGGGVIPIQGVAYSSVAKGETLEDTIATFSKLSDAIVLRHPQEGAAAIAAKASSVPVINAGDGVGEHPTQALLDLFTIRDHFEDLSNITVTLVGDLLYGRTVHSLLQLFGLFPPKKIILVSPDALRMPESLVAPTMHQTNQLDEALGETDVLYVTRVQKERFEDPASYDAVKDSFHITKETLEKVKPTAIIMHPFPRVNEIALEVDADSRAVYLREQIANGLYVRMAILDYIFTQ
jgi:aspartate carbamoyltransferase catalytic subunit